MRRAVGIPQPNGTVTVLSSRTSGSLLGLYLKLRLVVVAEEADQ